MQERNNAQNRDIIYTSYMYGSKLASKKVPIVLWYLLEITCKSYGIVNIGTTGFSFMAIYEALIVFALYIMI